MYCIHFSTLEEVKIKNGTYKQLMPQYDGSGLAEPFGQPLSWEIMIDYVINDCCPTVISLEHLTRTPRPLTGAPLPYHGLFLVLVLVLAEVVGGGLPDPCLASTSIFFTSFRGEKI